jgi:pilus assembly protein CpaE
LRYALVRQQAGEGLIVEPKHGLARVLRFAHDNRQVEEERIVEPDHRKSAQVIGFLGAKGGVGTTTVALNVALALARQQKSVILAEMRPSFGTLACRLRQHPPKNLRTLLDDTTDHYSANDLQALLCKGPSGLRILFGPQPEDLFKEIDPDHAEAVIKGLATMADFIILDLPDQHSVTTQTAVRLCRFAIVVTEGAHDSVVCAKVALKQLQSWGVASNSVGTVIVNRTKNPSPITLTEIGTRLGCEVVGVVPPGTSACFQAPEEVGVAEVLKVGDQVAASFVEIANHISDNRLVGMQV